MGKHPTCWKPEVSQTGQSAPLTLAKAAEAGRSIRPPPISGVAQPLLLPAQMKGGHIHCRATPEQLSAQKWLQRNCHESLACTWQGHGGEHEEQGRATAIVVISLAKLTKFYRNVPERKRSGHSTGNAISSPPSEGGRPVSCQQDAFWGGLSSHPVRQDIEEGQPSASTHRRGWELLPRCHPTPRHGHQGTANTFPLCCAAGSWFSPLFIAVIALGLQWPQEAATFPAMPLSNLFANAVLRAQHLHLLAAETYKEFERTYIPEDQRHANKNSQAAFCYSETIPAPTGKDDAQQKSDMELLRFSLVLIQSWLTPVQYLSKVFTNNLVFGTSDRVYEKLKDLEEGIQALMRELEERSPRGPQTLKPTYDKFDIHLRTEDALLKNYSLLSCFKKDLHKVETYLKVMKCRRFGEGNCTV
ncbi:somatotropin [Rhynochetos jubatus]